jgi:hypothetical protein
LQDIKRLVDIGFENVGHWVLAGDRIRASLTSAAGSERVLYAFSSNGKVLYIGKTVQALKKRLSGYEKPGSTQSTNIKNNRNILEALSNGGKVDIWALTDRGQLQVGEFKVNLAAGLEDDLINKIHPPWNGRKAAPGSSSTEESVAENSHPELESTRFDFILRKTYYNQGFFNVGINFENLFAGDDTPIDIHLGTGNLVTTGHVNRSVNTNNTPRIMGGVKLRDWFHRNFKVDETVRVAVLSKTSIRIFQPA